MFDFEFILLRFIGSALTLYMMALCLRWLAPYIELDMDSARWRPVTRITDRHFQIMRDLLKRVGPLGPMDWGPIAALISVWIIRLLLVRY